MEKEEEEGTSLRCRLITRRISRKNASNAPLRILALRVSLTRFDGNVRSLERR